jgi:hypothetical protein
MKEGIKGEGESEGFLNDMNVSVCFVLFFSILGLKLRAYTPSHSTHFFVMCVF